MATPAALGAAAGLAASLASKASFSKSWKDRIKQGAYTSPVSKTRILFDFGDVSRGFDIRGAKFDFPGIDNSYIQPNGYSSREYPLVCFFSGKNCDLIATAFEAALLETGIGRLEHPLYGTIPVIPNGRVERNDALVTAANQSVVTVTFFTTVDAVYPSSQSNALNEIQSAIDGFNVAMAQQFVRNTNLSKVGSALGAIGTFKKFLKQTKAALKKASSAVASVRKDFANTMAEINEGMDVLIGQPLNLAKQCAGLIQAPGRALAGLESRLEGYDILANSIIASVEAAPGNLIDNGSILLSHQTKVANDFHISNLFALSAVSGSAISTIAQPIRAGVLNGTGFSTRSQVVAAASALLEQFDAINASVGAGFAALATIDMPANMQIDTGEAYQALQQVIALTAGYLVQASFSLLPERSIVLKQARTIVDLSSELYGSVDSEKLDLIVGTNNLTGDEIIELPQGRRILYYPS